MCHGRELPWRAPAALQRGIGVGWGGRALTAAGPQGRYQPGLSIFFFLGRCLFLGAAQESPGREWIRDRAQVVAAVAALRGSRGNTN